MYPTTQQIRELAKTLHEGQYDKTDRPYFEHVDRVASCFPEGSDEWAVALLHDSIEDLHTTADELRAFGLSEHVVQAILLLTHSKEEKYHPYVMRIRNASGLAGIIARSVKLADILDNVDPARLFYIEESKRYKMLIKYHRALKDLLL